LINFTKRDSKATSAEGTWLIVAYASVYICIAVGL